MYKQNVSLQSHDKNHRQWLCAAEAERLVKEGKAIRITPKKCSRPIYRMKWFPEASESHESAASITPADTRAAVGLQRVNEVWIERLVGFKLIPEGTPVPAHGYL